MARWPASAKWAAGPALDGQRDMPLALRLSEGLDRTGAIGSWMSLRITDQEPSEDERGAVRAQLCC